jgi:PAT family beta-lactamase induction signal transducer AmpG
MTPTESLPPTVEAAARQRSAWFWVPSLYFSQGIPYVIVMTMSVIMYKRLGISNSDIALYTSWLYLPWVIKPLWSPLVDITRTKRFWVVAMQFLVSTGLASVAFAIPGPGFFKWSLFLFWIMAFASATHDIAADGFYMLSLSKHEQAWWVGLRSTFYRTATIVGSGLLVVLAGDLEIKNGLAPVECRVSSFEGERKSPLVPAALKTRTSSSGDKLRLIVEPESLEIPINEPTAPTAQNVIADAQKWNQEHGFLQEITVSKDQGGESWWGKHLGQPLSDHVFAPLGAGWTKCISEPLAHFLLAHFPDPSKSTATSEERGTASAPRNTAILNMSLSGPPSAGHPIVVRFERKKRGIEYLGLAKGDKGFRLLEGERLVFTETNWNQPAHAVIELDPKLNRATTVSFIATSGNIPMAWSITLFVVALLFLAFSIWHSLILPRPANDVPVIKTSPLGGTTSSPASPTLIAEFFSTLGSFFQKPGVLLALAFILLYRFDEAQLGKVISPFLLDSRSKGGLALTTSQVGLAYGTFGILALTSGGLLGGFMAANYGLKRMLPIMVCSMYLPKITFVVLSFIQPENFLAICGAIALEQLGYGFGFTAFMLYMLYFADGPHKTAHYAICTGFMALGMMIPGMWSGWVQEKVGYQHFFVWVICSAVPGFILAMLLKVDPKFGKRQ